MNFTEQYRARTLAFIMPPNESAISGWKGHALRITVFAVGFGIYVLLFKRKDSSSGRWSLRRARKTPIEPDNISNTEMKELSSDDRSIVAYNGEVCPICLGVPKIGVKAPCGHLLCAECLANYCDVRIAPAPPPCPLCRAPLNSVALVCDFAILGPKMLDPNTIMVRDWIREYNNHRGLMTSVRSILTTRLVLFFNILTLFLIVGLIAARLQ
ncbi:PREDICTED: E3 ubiquitin-protein ligase RNF170-like isoform X2 [Wasmannia auropunctata]|nr:PREDICTED: E3 ubiquitin-protein ligase RNF170-like isoform X2 [Wasmannia auropunctata]